MTLHQFASRDEWLAFRVGKIGASQAAAAIGLHPHRTVSDVWMESLHPADVHRDEEDEVRMAMGLRMEPIIVGLLRDATNLDAHAGALINTWSPDDIPWLIATPDARGERDSSYGVELKNTGEYSRTRWGLSGATIDRPMNLDLTTASIADYALCPIEYEIQCRIGMACTGLDRWYLAVLIGGWDFRWYAIERCMATEAALIARLTDFCEAHILTGTAPREPDDTMREDVLRVIYPELAPGKRVTADEQAHGAANMFADSKSKIKDIKKDEEFYRALLIEAIGDASEIEFEGYQSVIKYRQNRNGTRVLDSKKFVAEFLGDANTGDGND